MQSESGIPYSSTPKQRLPPGPPAYPIIGHTLKVQRDTLKFYMDIARKYGDIVRYNFMFRMGIFVNHPNYVKHILQEHNQQYSKEVFNYEMLTWFSGDGLLTSGGEKWLKQRRFMQPAFHRQKITGFGTIMTGVIADLLERWRKRARPEQPLDVNNGMMNLALAIASKSLFGYDLSNEANQIGPLFTVLNQHYENYIATLLLPPSIPIPRNRRFQTALEGIDRFIFDLIRQRRAASAQNDLLSMLLEVRDEETGTGMSDRQLRDELITLLFAGHETTANALTWTWYMLAQNPTAEQKMHAEIDAVLQGREPSIEDLPRLPYTRMVLDETLRLYPPVWFIPRKAVVADEIGNYTIPKGAMVHLSPYVLHRHPSFWENPEAFQPERFLPAAVEARPRYAYTPFGGGPRLCIGNTLALTEAHLILAMIGQHYRLRLHGNNKVVPVPQITLRPRHGLPMMLQPRSS